MKISPKLGQSILGFVFAFIIIAAMAVGLTRVWVWFNVNYGVRQVRYQESRTAATAKWGSSGSGNAYLSQQINRELYKSLDLDDEWLFKGKATTEVPYILPDIVSPISAAALCANQCPECVQKRIPEGCDCTADGCECISNPNCVCFMQCMCRASIQLRLDAYDLNIQSLKETAAGMRQEARKLEKKAEECDDPWEFCWWGGFGVPAKKLKQAAGKLRGQAESLCCGWCDHCGCSGKTCPECAGCVLNSKAALLGRQKAELEACCRTETKADMELCFMDIAARQCPALRDANVAFWDESIRVIQGEINLTTAIRARIPGERDNYCPKWALLRCKYTNCRPGAESSCQLECENYGHNECTARCDTECTADCTYADPVVPPDPPGPPYLHEDCYAIRMATCLNDHCNHVCPGCDWYEELYNYCMTNTYPICVQDKINACDNAECNSSHPLWQTYMSECCNSFCCTESGGPPSPETWNCTWGVLDRNKWGYTRASECGRGHCPDTWIGCAETECTDEYGNTLPVPPMNFKLPTGGDGCQRTWNCKMDEVGLPGDHRSGCYDRPWMRNCVEAPSICDEECAEGGPMSRYEVPGYSPPVYSCKADPAGGYPVPLSCFTGVVVRWPPGCDPINPPDCEDVELRTQCGLPTFADRQDDGVPRNASDARDCFLYEVDRFNGKKEKIACCCCATPECCSITWTPGPEEDPTNGTCLSPGRELIVGKTKPECQAICMADAGNYGEELGNEGEGMCPECFPEEPLAPDDLDDCLRDCYGGETGGCCSYWCGKNCLPEKGEECFNRCKANCNCVTNPDGTLMDCVAEGAVCVGSCMGSCPP